jgi:hypothetical protein
MQIFFNCSSTNTAEHGKPGKEIIDRLLVSHAAKIEDGCTVRTSGTW